MEMKLHTILCVAVIQQLVKALNHLTIAWRVLHTIACVIKSRIIKSRGARARDTRRDNGWATQGRLALVGATRLPGVDDQE